MSALTGEIIVCGQHHDGDTQLRIFGDEFYARYEILDGYTVVYDSDQGSYCYALLAAGRFLSSGIPACKPPPAGLQRHLREDPAVRNEKFELNYNLFRPRETEADSSASRTLGPDGGLLSGRKLHHGTVRGLTIIVEFDDVTTSITRDAVDAMFNSPSYSVNGNYCSVNEYFKIVSSGKLDYVNVVVGPIKLSKRRSHYISNLMVKEVLDIAIADFGIDLSDFDSRDEGIVDAINILYAGDSQYNGNLWPHNSVARHQYGSTRSHYYQLTGLGSHTVDLRIGTICHENGHLLCRFPDMYDYGKRDGDFEKSQGIGRYCLMGSGNHLNERRSPSPVCAYLRELAGWVDEVVILDSPKGHSLPHGAYNKAWKSPTTLPNEYFMIENRTRMGLDTHLPSSGLAIYHCDTLGSNEWQDGTRNQHYQCALLQADGHLDLENNRNAGDATDLFSEITGVAVSDNTTPSSRMWNGTDSGLLISEVGAAGQDIPFTFGEPRGQPVATAEVFPNQIIPDDDPAGLESMLVVNKTGEITRISVNVDIIHSWISDLIITLVSPDGVEVVLHEFAGGNGDDIRKTYDSANLPALTVLAGESLQGNWVLKIVDRASQDVGRLLHWGLEIEFLGYATSLTESVAANLPIPDRDPRGVSSVIDVNVDGELKSVAVEIDIRHSYIGDLRVELVSPSGHTVRLHDRQGGGTNDLKRIYDSSSTAELDELIGESIHGTWQLQVRDLAYRDTGDLVSWSLTIDY